MFAAGLAEGFEVAAAAQRATAAAALSVTKVGAREGMPTREELDAFLRTRDADLGTDGVRCSGE